jgi:hypothetical protein
MFIAKTDTTYSSIYIINELLKYSVSIKPILERYLGYWYEARYDEATKYFNDAIGTKDAERLSSLLLKIDHLKPEDFIQQLELYQNTSREDRKTAAQKSKEDKSNFLYVVVYATGLIILLNFSVVAFIIDFISTFNQMLF